MVWASKLHYMTGMLLQLMLVIKTVFACLTPESESES